MTDDPGRALERERIPRYDTPASRAARVARAAPPISRELGERHLRDLERALNAPNDETETP